MQPDSASSPCKYYLRRLTTFTAIRIIRINSFVRGDSGGGKCHEVELFSAPGNTLSGGFLGGTAEGVGSVAECGPARLPSRAEQAKRSAKGRAVAPQDGSGPQAIPGAVRSATTAEQSDSWSVSFWSLKTCFCLARCGPIRPWPTDIPGSPLGLRFSSIPQHPAPLRGMLLTVPAGAWFAREAMKPPALMPRFVAVFMLVRLPIQPSRRSATGPGTGVSGSPSRRRTWSQSRITSSTVRRTIRLTGCAWTMVAATRVGRGRAWSARCGRAALPARGPGAAPRGLSPSGATGSARSAWWPCTTAGTAGWRCGDSRCSRRTRRRYLPAAVGQGGAAKISPKPAMG